ncbi:dNA-binding helix-turn-helix protein [Mycoplasma sp. CAG:776]|nr:dNA-binding helix-turn-helix protein [Mycoplasma sp. CAG:776]
MNIGNKISELRKKNNYTQEELAEKLNVSRQTISKWELNETSPSLEDAAKLAKIFHVSLNELVGEENILEEKMSNVERLAGIIIKILKIIGIIIIIYIIFIIIAILTFTVFKDKKTEEINVKSSLTCNLNEETETFTITTKNDKIIEMSNNIEKIIDVKENQNSNDIFNLIKDYYIKNNGNCN